MQHSSIQVKPAYHLPSESDVLVVCRGDITGTRRIERDVIRGPNTFYPSLNENVVSFNWSKPSESFQILSTAFRTWKVDFPYYLSSTLNGTLQLTFTFCISDVEALVDNTKNLTGDMYDMIAIDLVKLGKSCLLF